VVDVFFVARLGADAVATVGLTESLLTLIFAVAMGLSMATTAYVARRIGEKDPQGASVAAVQSILIGIVLSLLIGAVCAVFAPQLLRLMGASPDVVRVGSGFTAVLLGGTATVLLLFLNNAIFRGAGDAVIAMRALWLANIINIILEPCLIFGWGPFPKWGLTGAAIGTTIGRGTGVVYQLWVLLGGRSRVVVRRQHLRLAPAVLLRLIRVSLSGIVQFFIGMASWLGLVRIIALFGSSALAGYTIAVRILVFALLPAWGMSNAAATLVGQNLGAKKPDRAERSVWLTAFYNMLFLGGVAVLFILFAGPLIRLFTTDPAVVPIGVACLRFISYGYVFYAYGMVMVQAFNGAGDTTTPMTINLFCYWLWEIPLAYGLAMWARLGVNGVFLAITIAESTIAVVGVLAFRRGRWKKQAI
ncbi:MAG: MATE family efflux transporter, partial [Acidobacteria bacterium]|nr:MATE family efflux transporter [Acidobacteriota bacterium]